MASVPAARLPLIHEVESSESGSQAPHETPDHTRSSPSHEVEQRLKPWIVPSHEPGEVVEVKPSPRAAPARQPRSGIQPRNQHPQPISIPGNQRYKDRANNFTSSGSPIITSKELANRDSAISLGTRSSQSSKNRLSRDAEQLSSSNGSPLMGSRRSTRSTLRIRDSGYASASIPEHDQVDSECGGEGMRLWNELPGREASTALTAPLNHRVTISRQGSHDGDSHSEQPGLAKVLDAPLVVGLSKVPSTRVSQVSESIDNDRIVRSSRASLISTSSQEPFSESHSGRPLEEKRGIEEWIESSVGTPSQQNFLSTVRPVASESSRSISDSRVTRRGQPIIEEPVSPHLPAYNAALENFSNRSDLKDRVYHAVSSFDRITFDPTHVEKLSVGCYMDRWAPIPEAINQKFNKTVKSQLHTDVQELIQNTGVGKEVILSTVQLCMVGAKQGNMLRAEPTILVTVGTKECQKKVAKNLTRLKLHYLDDFPIKVRYQRGPSYWTASTGKAKVPESRSISLQKLEIQASAGNTTSCGLKMELTMVDDGVDRQVYSTLGGILNIGGTFYGMTTAHSFLAKSDKRARSGDCELFGSWSTSNTDRETLYGPELRQGLTYSFLGQLSKANSRSQSNEFSTSDWALFTVPKSCVMPNINRPRERLTSIRPESELTPGEVDILHGFDSRYSGYLTQPDVAFFTSCKRMDVREIMLDIPLPSGVSGSWVVRDYEVLGYVVAVTSGASSCFMVPMERAFRDIETVFGQGILISWEPHEMNRRSHRETIANQYHSNYDVLAPLSDFGSMSQHSSRRTESAEGQKKVSPHRRPRSVLSTQESATSVISDTTDELKDWLPIAIEKPAKQDKRIQNQAYPLKKYASMGPAARRKKTSLLTGIMTCWR